MDEKQKESRVGIVSEIKNKIAQFKERKEIDRENSKNNELDIQVNKDLLNTFKKTKTPDREDKSSIRDVINSNLAKKKFCFQPGSNRRPSACKADVITTTLWKLDERESAL